MNTPSGTADASRDQSSQQQSQPSPDPAGTTAADPNADPSAPGTDPLGGGPDFANREQVSVQVDPEMPYVKGQSDPYADKRNAAGQLSPEDGAAPVE